MTVVNGTNENELLSSLGLDTTAAETAAANEVAPEAAHEAAVEGAEKAVREAIKITGTIAVASGELPAEAPRGGFATGERGSKYPFADLVAPVKNEETGKFAYSFFEVKLTDVENADAKKLQGAIQAAVAAQNKKHKEKGEVVKYVSRTLLDAQEAYVGSAVYRVDATI
jgi:hypothetical protein